MLSGAFWLAVGQIIWINILLSGDNAVVIAMACRSLPPRSRKWGMMLGAGIAVALRIVFTMIVVTLMEIPFLRAIGAVALIYIAVDLVRPKDAEEHDVQSHDNLLRAMITIGIADVVMSLDNVIAIAAVAQGHWGLLILGLVISVPLIVAGSALIMMVLDRFPFVVWAGAALLGWIAGELLFEDVGVQGYLGDHVAHGYARLAAIVGAALVLLIGYVLVRSKRALVDGPDASA